MNTNSSANKEIHGFAYFDNEKSAQRRKHGALAVVRRSQNSLPLCIPPSQGHRMANI